MSKRCLLVSLWSSFYVFSGDYEYGILKNRNLLQSTMKKVENRKTLAKDDDHDDHSDDDDEEDHT